MRGYSLSCLAVLLACSGRATPSEPSPPAPVVAPPAPVVAPPPRIAPPRFVEPGEQSTAPLPHVLMRPSRTTGPLVSDVIHPVLLRDLASFRHCYQVARVTQPTLAGAITVRFTIHAAGDTADVSAATDPGLEQVGACVRAIVSRERYRAENADTHVELPMTMALPLGM